MIPWKSSVGVFMLLYIVCCIRTSKEDRISVKSVLKGDKGKLLWTRRGREKRDRRNTEGTCYALRDMSEACRIHNSVKTKMLRSCHFAVTFFLVSWNVQLAFLSSAPFLSLLWLIPGPSSRNASSLFRFSGNVPRNEKRFVKNVSASSYSTYRRKTPVYRLIRISKIM